MDNDDSGKPQIAIGRVPRVSDRPEVDGRTRKTSAVVQWSRVGVVDKLAVV